MGKEPDTATILAEVRRILRYPKSASNASIPFVVEQMMASAEANQQAFWKAEAEVSRLLNRYDLVLREEGVAWVYEARDASNDETYRTLGMYGSLEDAVAEYEAIEDPAGRLPNCYDDSGYAKVAIVRWALKGGDKGSRTVWVKEWFQKWDENADDDADPVWHSKVEVKEVSP